MSDSAVLREWKKKLEALQIAEVRATDAAERFKLQQEINEAHARIAGLDGTAATAPEGPRISPSRLKHSAVTLFGREQELAALEAAWQDPATHVLTIVAWGGVGKTSLVATWSSHLAARDYDGARYFDWSFYSQGTKDQGSVSADQFISKALEFFGDPAFGTSSASSWDKGARLAQLIANIRTLLVLDGLEPLQHPPGPLAGELRDPGLVALLRGLAQRNPGFCVVTTREPVSDLRSAQASTAPQWELQQLSREAGVELLHALGVKGTLAERGQLVGDVKGHALTLNLVGRYLARAHGGDIRYRDAVKFERADAKLQGGHAFKVMAAYEKWLEREGGENACQLAILWLLGLFDRPADASSLAALRRAPAIQGLTESLVNLTEEDWNFAVSDLREFGFVALDHENIERLSMASIDAHPLVREYFAARLRTGRPEAWASGHLRLFRHLSSSVEHEPSTLNGLQPLYQAIRHGALAGQYQEALLTYSTRILRGPAFYSLRKFGVFAADLGALASFFELPWRIVVPDLKVRESWLLSTVGACLRALGRLEEAVEPMQASLDQEILAERWWEAADIAGNLSELKLTLGRVGEGLAATIQGIEYANKSEVYVAKLFATTKLGYALYTAGQTEGARARYEEAERLEAEDDPAHPLLYSQRGFQYSEVLLATVERNSWRVTLADGIVRAGLTDAERTTDLETLAEVERRAITILEWHRGYPELGLLDTGLNLLILGRITLFRKILDPSTPAAGLDPQVWGDAVPRDYMDAAMVFLRRAGQQDDLPRVLLSRAWLRFQSDDFDSARSDLDEAWQVSERGPMRLHMADIYLYRARLFRAITPYPWGSPQSDFTAARRLIEQCGYRRRDAELKDTEAAADH